jgi:alpha-N-arabinofuranosidase
MLGAVLLAFLGVAGAPGAEPPIKNAGFEDKLENWSTHVYGAPSQVEVDDQVAHEGKHSLRVRAGEVSDTALGQEITVKPGQWYRFSGWVRTRGLDPHGVPVYGTYQIQRPSGQGVLAGGAKHQGDTDWTEVPIFFQGPADGRVRIAVFFVGFGRGTGTAWFDDLRLDEVDLARQPIRITRDPLVPGEINKFQYGQFVEYLCNLIPSMWAEKLYDGSFEGLSPYKFVYLKETDFREKPWYPRGATNRAVWSLDPTNPISGKVAQKIAATGITPCTVGIAQDGIALARGQACLFSCYLRSQGVKGEVEVQLHREGKVYATCRFQPGPQWKKFQARLVPSDTDTQATLSISFRGPGTLWLDNASLMPENTVGGWRRDVVEAVRALKPAIIRFGGSALDDSNLGEFEWRDTIGDPDRRKPFRAWGGLQPTGPGLEEIVQFFQHVDAEPLICIRVSERNPKDAADQVQYFNGGLDTPMGKLRARNGHEQPYGIKYWQVGNERSGRAYETQLPGYCKALKAVDPTIQLLSSYPTEGVLRQAGEYLDYVCPHHYDCENLPATEGNLIAVRGMLRKHAPGRPIKVGVTEWNTTAGDAGPKRARLWTLENALACSRYHNLIHRHADLVTIANRSNLANSFCSGIIQTDNHRLYKTPTYYAQQLYATRAGNRPLRIESALPANQAPDLSAALSASGDAVILFAVNTSLEEVTRQLDLSAFGEGGQEYNVWTLTDRQQAGEPDVANSFDYPERISPVTSKQRAASARFTYRFPALSLTVIEWRVAR